MSSKIAYRSRDSSTSSESQASYCKKHKACAKDFATNYKTEICRKWENGECHFGKRCAFAHGLKDLRVKHNLPKKYKTKNCKTFFEQGYCLYGSRCQFSHQHTTTIPSCSNRYITRLPVFLQITN